jgi:CheY-like chemotaxis protein/HPt (histidine-containing phosphotransfer) domain-containing protein
LLQALQRAMFGAEANPPPAEPPVLAPGGASLAMNILLVEDHPVNQQLAVSLLTRWGHRVSLAENGQQALEALAEQAFDLVLMDMMMPVLGGLEATQRFRAQEQGRRTPIVAMTAKAMQGDREQCLAAGMDDYLAKPIVVLELQRMVERYAPAGAAPVSPPQDAPLGASPAGAALSAFDYVQGLAGADQSVVNIIRAIFVQRWPPEREKMLRALAAGEWQDLMHVAHALKGTLGMFGAHPAALLAGQVETQANLAQAAALAMSAPALAAEVDKLVLALRQAGA